MSGTAVFYRGTEITYSQLNGYSLSAAKALKNMNAAKGSEIIVCMPNIPEVIYLMLAASRIGAVLNFVRYLDWDKDFYSFDNLVMDIKREHPVLSYQEFLQAGKDKLPFFLRPASISVVGGNCEHGGSFFTLLKGTREKLSRNDYGLQPFQLTELEILRDDGTECDYGETGILAANSPCTMKEYWINMEESICGEEPGMRFNQLMGNPCPCISSPILFWKKE